MQSAPMFARKVMLSPEPICGTSFVQPAESGATRKANAIPGGRRRTCAHTGKMANCRWPNGARRGGRGLCARGRGPMTSGVRKRRPRVRALGRGGAAAAGPWPRRPVSRGARAPWRTPRAGARCRGGGRGRTRAAGSAGRPRARASAPGRMRPTMGLAARDQSPKSVRSAAPSLQNHCMEC